jgi:hypothetical protein
MVLGVRQATCSPIGLRSVGTGKLPATNNYYDELSEAIGESQSTERLIEDFKPNAHCPFQIFYGDKGIEILCDKLQMKKCTSDHAHCEDVWDNYHQAYAKVKGTRRKMKVGCIYHPKVIGLSVEAPDTVYSHIVY